MMLESVQFVQYRGKPLEWHIDGLALQPINLIVGRNASGKTKALLMIEDLAELVSGTMPSERSGSYVARFRDPEITYELRIEDARVLREDLTIGGEKKLWRGEDGAGQMYFAELGKFVAFQVPETTLVCGTRRDSIQHPYLQGLYDWGDAALSYRFNSGELGKGTLAFIPEPLPDHPIFRESAEEPGILRAIHAIHADAFGGDLRATVVRDMNALGYAVTAVGTKRTVPRAEPATRGNFVALCVTEVGLGDVVDQFDMSDGMFRALVVLIEVTYAAMSGKPGLVLIDDIGEGLDYERSCLLIKLLVDKAKRSGLQLFMTTNDRFVMNNVPLEHWSVLVREPAPCGTRVRVYNHENSRKAFEEFAYTGLNNFDFFATSFFAEGAAADA